MVDNVPYWQNQVLVSYGLPKYKYWLVFLFSASVLNTFTFFNVKETMFTVGSVVLNGYTMEFFVVFLMR